MANEIFMPKLSSTMAEGTVIEWFKEEGDTVEVGEPILEIMTDKINIEVESYNDGILLKKYFETDDVVPVNHVIGFIGEAGESVPDEAPGESSGADSDNGPEEAPSQSEQPEGHAKDSESKSELSGKRESMIGKVRATPAARAHARTNDVDIKQITGSGRNGRIHKADVVNHLSAQSKTPAKQAESVDAPVTEVTASQAATVQTEKLRGSRKVTADRMADSSATIPHVTLNFEVEMEPLIELRKDLNEKYKDVKVSFNDLFILIASKALVLHPDVNITFKDNEISYHEERNISLAVAVEKELFVPVVKNTEKMGLFGISKESRRLIEDTRSRKLSQEDMTGGTFTISNLGMYSITSFTPIINKPQAAILGIGATTEQPTLRDGVLHNRKIATLSLSFDHRVINGAPAAAFCDTVKKLTENPIELIL
ncbi:dihydrolipoamide acetyltransferase family protein [Salinicoccus hispanicus]|uniref:Dihydrolipoamide acetyltransferase component of pyruvate dehydrogenase complex n=1 Tax=Salinicoccus hispanicus TaxID=157225 RepID=A0A6N8U093_9STAP|nr:dihydrolipoamide acetyltransferase family protein [Salinicoccus hispanicus]MXQ51490.1 2-oxo acid dehydrogenase subunit E2 [Salinicoccus hispanicus]